MKKHILINKKMHSVPHIKDKVIFNETSITHLQQINSLSFSERMLTNLYLRKYFVPNKVYFC